MLTKLLKRAQNGRSKTIFLDTTLDEGTAYANEIIFVIEKKSRQQSVKVYLAPFLSSVMYRWKLTDLQYPFECPASSSQMSTSSLPPISSLKPLGAQVFRSKKQQSSPLVNLPTEILVQIFSYINLHDTIALSTSCKYLLSILSFAAFPGDFLFKKLPDLAPIKLILFLLGLLWPREMNGRPKKGLRYCNACRRIYPEKRQYWEEKLSMKISRDFLNRDCPKCYLGHKRTYMCLCHAAFIKRWEQICAEHIGWFGN
ncbi:F-box protein [Aspergillus fumigatus Af293]|uniref:F-box domain protein n=2 Tax=Aspergillus fumigatus TaxID=746128 RepID=Q4X1M7_ASPFU|nr:F-box domain protein [Aspergillus fumigatus Af293]EAL93238.1 F-box domain protein [Aspergillus fumigatus Af293]EDP54472.1 F-box domain protein [Aspergillus fumigatus A1163]